MENWKALFDRNFKKVSDKLEKQYKADIEKAGDKEFVHREFRDNILKEGNKLNNDSAPFQGQIFTVIHSIAAIQKRDKNYNFNSAFEEITKDYSLKNRKIIINKISKIEAYPKFYNDFLPEQEKAIKWEKMTPEEQAEEQIKEFESGSVNPPITPIPKGIIKRHIFTPDFVDTVKEIISDYYKSHYEKLPKKQINKYVDSFIKDYFGDIIEKLKGIETIIDQQNFLIKERGKIQASSFPEKLESILKLKNIETKTKAFYEKNNELIAKSIEEKIIELLTKMIEECNKEIAHEPEINKPLQIEMKDGITGNPEFTIRRQVLAIHYLLKVANCKANIPSEKTRFVHFMTGKELNKRKIKDTYIYKIVANPLPLSDKRVIQDLQFVRNFFENMGIQSVIDEINKEIGNRE